MTASMAGFVFNDAAMKLGATDMGIYQAIFVRGLFASLIIGLFALTSGAFKQVPWRRDTRLIILRSIMEVGATLCFLTALVHLPLANVSAIMQALPLTVSLGAAWFLNEKIGWKRIIAILIGLFGVLLIIRPGPDGFNIYAVLTLFAVAFVTARDLIVRGFSPNLSSLVVTFVTAIIITCAGGIATLIIGEWTPINAHEIMLLSIAAIMIFIGYYCSVSAMRFGEISLVAPFRYTIMLWAILLGWFIWGETPDKLTLLGIVIIIAAGAFTFWRERCTNGTQV